MHHLHVNGLVSLLAGVLYAVSLARLDAKRTSFSATRPDRPALSRFRLGWVRGLRGVAVTAIDSHFDVVLV